MAAAQGILTVRGGMTSHAAVVARGMGTCCVSGCGEITMHEEEKYFTLAGKDYHEGDWISIDGSTGNIYGCAVKTVEATISGNFDRFMKWADSFRVLRVRTNADNPRDTAQAVKFGAEGIGLCRTEHMFFEATRIKAMREMIVAKTVEARKEALAKILPYQQGDFEAMYRELKGRPMTIRFLDPPLHEFLPTKEEDIAEIAEELHVSVAELKDVIASLHEFNPMMGHRGCRLAVTYPEIAEMQTAAVINAAIKINKEFSWYRIEPEIMIPLVGEVKELKFVKDVVTATADRLIEEAGRDRHRGRVLLLRHERPDPDDVRLQPRRRRQVPRLLLRPQDLRVRSVRPPRPEGRRQAREDGRRNGPRHPSAHQARHLRRARRRSRFRRVLPQRRPELRLLQPVPCPHRPPRCCAGCHPRTAPIKS